MGCPSCGRGFHLECETKCDECHPLVKQQLFISTTPQGTRKGAPVKSDEDINDPYSTGRKRAAIKYPIHKTNPCEWRGKKNCGGGLNPIIGCIDGNQRDRHHGPIKNPLRNENGNVHRICKKCHNRWHEMNDSIYDKEVYSKIPHNPEKATEFELLANEAKWKSHL